MTENKEISGISSVSVSFSGGEMNLQIGQEFSLTGKGRWRIENFTGYSIYSPSGFDGTPIVRCSYLGGASIEKDQLRFVKDGKVEFCGDSVALAISLEQKTPKQPQKPQV